MELSSNIRDLFVRMGYKWRIKRGDESVLDTPSLDDVESLIENMSEQLDNNAGSWVESGRILIKNDYGYRDVYVHMGTIDTKENNND